MVDIDDSKGKLTTDVTTLDFSVVRRLESGNVVLNLRGVSACLKNVYAVL